MTKLLKHRRVLISSSLELTSLHSAIISSHQLVATHSRRCQCQHRRNSNNVCYADLKRQLPYHNKSLRISFWCGVSEVGNLILMPTMKSPRSLGFLLFGIPRLGKRSVQVGCVGPLCRTLSCLPSIVETVRLHPVSASLRSTSTVALMSSPSLVKIGCGFCKSISKRRFLEATAVDQLLTSSTMKCKSCVPPST
jgi:hypothetical protein